MKNLMHKIGWKLMKSGPVFTLAGKGLIDTRIIGRKLWSM